MENCLSITESYYKDIDGYKIDVDTVIISMISKNERLVFAVIAERSGVTRFVVRQYPQLRNYILEKMIYYKEIHVINQKIDRAVKSLIKSGRTITFMAIINKCRITTDMAYQNVYIKNRIRNVLSQNKQKIDIKNFNIKYSK